MRTTITTLIAALAAITLSACGGSDGAAKTTSGNADTKGVSVTGAWARTTAPGAKTGAVYLAITSENGDTLTAVAVPASVAAEAQMHEATGGGEMTHDGGGSAPMNTMMGMRQVHRIEIPAGHTVRLEPGGHHIMLMGLAAPVTAGQKIPVTLTFQQAGKVTVDAVARDR